MNAKYQLIHRVTFCVFVLEQVCYDDNAISCTTVQSNGPLLTCLRKDAIILIFPYSYLLFKICRAYTDCRFFCCLYISHVLGTFVLNYAFFVQHKKVYF